MKKTIKTLVLVIAILSTVEKSQAQTIITVAGNNHPGYSGDGFEATTAQLFGPSGVALDAVGNLYVADFANSRIRKVTPSGIITTFAGNGTAGYSGDGGQATAAGLNNAACLAFDASGNLYIGDYGNNRIRKVNTSGIISTIAGTGAAGFSGDGGQATAAELHNPAGVTIDAFSNLYIADYLNNVIRMVTVSTGIISTVAGNNTQGYTGDGGQATVAELNRPYGVVLDNSGNIYIADTYNHRIRKVYTSGIISTIAGNSTGGFTGDGAQATAAELNSPAGLTIDAVGNVLYIADTYNERIRKINTVGIITTIAGIGTTGWTGDNGPATAAQLYNPSGIALDISGNIYIADAYNSVIREVGACIPIIPSICMVESDTLSTQNNVIYWQNIYPADTFYIYRDTANYNYALIGKVPASDTSMFADTARHIYHANGDPMASSWRYKIAYTDTCGGGRRMSPMSLFHETVFLQQTSPGAFSWNLYQIEGESAPIPQVSEYWFEVDSFSTGHFHDIQYLSASSTAYTDGGYAGYPNPTYRCYAYGFGCTPSALRLSGNNSVDAAKVKSHSNTYNNRTSDIKQFVSNNEQINIYPNPTKDVLNIELGVLNKNRSLQITDMLGNTVKQVQFTTLHLSFNISDLAEGIYNISIQNSASKITKKLVIVK